MFCFDFCFLYLSLFKHTYYRLKHLFHPVIFLFEAGTEDLTYCAVEISGYIRIPRVINIPSHISFWMAIKTTTH